MAKKAAKKAAKKVTKKKVAKKTQKKSPTVSKTVKNVVESVVENVVAAVSQLAKKAGGRTTHRSSKGTKLYAVRDGEGQFKDIQTYKRAHGSDVKRKAKGEA